MSPAGRPGEGARAARDFDDWYADLYRTACGWAGKRRVPAADRGGVVDLAFMAAWRHWTVTDDPMASAGRCEDGDGCPFLWCFDEVARRTWLHRATIYRVFDFRKAAARVPETPVDDRTLAPIMTVFAGPEGSAIGRLDLEWVEQYLAGRPEHDVNVLLSAADGIPMPELAQETGESVDVLYGRLRRARAHMRDAWDQQRRGREA